MPSQTPLSSAIADYLDSIRDARSEHTYRVYRRGLAIFLASLVEAKLATPTTSVEELSLDWVKAFLRQLQRKTEGQLLYAPATENLYLTALLGFVRDHLGGILTPALTESIRVFVKRKRRKIPLRQPPFPQEQIEKLLEAIQAAAQGPFKDEEHRLSVLRDRALLITLADSGLRVFEICGLTRGQLDSPEGKVTIIGKGNKEARVRLSARALRALSTYIQARAKIDGAQKKELGTLPLLARHDWRARGKTLAMTTRSAERIIDRWVAAILGAEAVGSITPHTFRHYFVTVAIRGSGGDFQVAKELARHANIVTTQRYAHISDAELDRQYDEIFEGRKGALL